MKIKTNELTGAALDRVVAKCKGLAVSNRATAWRSANNLHAYSNDWVLGGPIIEREKINLGYSGTDTWDAGIGDHPTETGPTALIAAMRCYVASKLGDEVEVPDELCQPSL